MNTLRVLIADGDPHMRAFAKACLVSYKTRIDGLPGPTRFALDFVDADDALEVVATSPPEILVTDYGFGEERILEALQTCERNTAVVIAATRASIPAAVEATRLGAFDFLAKPVSPDRFRRAIREAAGHVARQTHPIQHIPAGRIRHTVGMLARLPAAVAHLAATTLT